MDNSRAASLAFGAKPHIHQVDPLALLFKGGDEAARQILSRHPSVVNSEVASIDWVELPSSVASHDQIDFVAFLREFNFRLMGLTKKERAVLNHVLEGETNKAISLRFDLTQRAVELRKASVMKKLNARSHTELIRLMTKYEVLRGLVLQQSEASGSDIAG